MSILLEGVPALLELQVKLDGYWDSRKELALSAVLFLTTTILFISYLISFKVKGFRKGVTGNSSNDTIPQPRTLPIIGNLHSVLPGSDYFKTFLKWATKYGKIYKLWLGWDEFYVINDPSMIQKILSSSNPHHMNRHQSIYNAAMSSLLKDGLLTSEYLLLDLDLFSDREAVNFHRSFQEGKKITSRRLLEPWLLIKPIWNLHPLSKVLRLEEESMENFVKTVLERFREKRATSLKDTISSNGQNEGEEDDAELGVRKFKCIMEEMMDSGMTDKEILVESLTILFAGHETTSTAMEFLLLRLALSPEHQERCREEVDELFERKTGSRSENFKPFDVDLSLDDLSQLKHVERCINENLRLLPIVPVFLRRLDEPLKLDDETELKAKSYIGIMPWTLHRLPEIWPDPERFDPDRFLPENVKKRHPYAYVPISAGPRNCIGYKTAQMQLKILTAWILRSFEVHTIDKWEDITLTFGVTLDTAKKINLRFKPRNVTEKRIETI